MPCENQVTSYPSSCPCSKLNLGLVSQLNVNEKGLTLTPLELEGQLQTIICFLKAVHPELLKEDGFRPSVELRPIPRLEKSYLLTKSLNLWNLDEESVNRLRSFLERHNGKGSCLYYSVFCYDNNKKSVTTQGTLAKPGKITSLAAISTEEIALDFDGIGFHDYTQLVDRFENLGIYALWVFTGHGYHAHILLKEPLTDKSSLRKFVYKFRSKGFFCDTACTDPARVMRLPGTYNNKCFQDEAYAAERNNPPLCAIMQDSAERYAFAAIMDSLDSLPTISKEDEDLFNDIGTVKKSSSDAPQPKDGKEVTSVGSDSVTVKRVVYPYISDYDLPEAVEKMLAHTPHGYRNKALGFLIKFLKTQYRMGQSQLFEVLSLWSREACEPAYTPSEFQTDFNRLYYQYNGLGYDPALAQKFGPIDFQGLIQLRKKDIDIPHSFFKDFPTLKSSEVRLYLAIKMLEHIEEPTTQEKIAEMLQISTRNLRPTLQGLIKSGHCYMKKGNPRMQIPNTYHSNRINSVHDGYVIFGYNDLKTYLTELCEQSSSRTRSSSDLKLYLFFRWKFYSGDIYMSQINLGKNIGVEQNTISTSVARLESLHFLKVRKRYLSPFMQSCEYTLLR